MKPSPKLSSKQNPEPSTTLNFEAIGTHWQIDLPKSGNLSRLESAIHRRIDTFDQHYSRFRPDSLVSQLAKQGGSVELPPDAKPLLDFYHQLYELTQGVVTPLIGQLVSDAGYDANYSLQPTKLSTPPSWEDIISYHGHQLTLSRPALLDFGAAGKGYLVDIICRLLEEHGVSNYCVDAGGDLRSTKPVEVGLENPNDASQAIGIAKIKNMSLCGSAGNRRKWGEYHHIMDPRTLTSTDQIKATWVTTKRCMEADGLATALFFVPPEKLEAHFSFDYCLITQNNALYSSKGFPATFFKES